MVELKVVVDRLVAGGAQPGQRTRHVTNLRHKHKAVGPCRPRQ